ncbi:hypothetical protein ACQKM9_00735 [Viridibacillus sp. NPDC093762]|uniref:hypothetical protein n=1 Tax=Viridibacillus sp. NPDC093762 TaxID=3390720 RepID=UPI003D059CA4
MKNTFFNHYFGPFYTLIHILQRMNRKRSEIEWFNLFMEDSGNAKVLISGGDSSGIKVTTGATVKTGSQVSNGINGINGNRGILGINGINGIHGIHGINGIHGTMGTVGN